MVRHGPEQLARLTGGTHNDALPVLQQQTLGDGGHPLEILQIGGGDHLVQVFQPHLVPGDQNDVLGEAVGLAAQGPQLLHLAVYRLEGVDAPLVEHLPEGDQHIAHGGGVVAGPVVVEVGQLQPVRHDVQLVLSQIRQQVLCQDQGVHIGGLEVQPHLPAARPDEADVKLCVVGRQGAAVHELQKFRQGLLQLRGVLQHIIGDSRKADDLRRQPPVGVDEGLEPIRNLTVFQHHGADLRNGLPVHLEARGLDVEAHELPVQGAVLRAVDHHPVIDVVDKVALHAIEDLDLVPSGVPSVREGLGHAVVRDGDGGMSPPDGLLDHLFRVRQGIHIAHLRVEVQLHTLLRGGILPLSVLRQLDVVGVQLDVLPVPGGLHLALDAQPHAGLDGALQSLSLLLRQVLLNGDGVGIVRHVEAQPPHTGPPGLPALEGEHLPRHGGIPHLQVQDLHGHRLDANGLAHQDLACGLLLALTAGGGRRDRSSRAAPCGCGLGRRSLAGDFRRHLSEAVYAHQQMLQLLQLRISQLRPGGEAQRQRHAGLVDASAVHHCAGQTKPQLSGELQLSKHFEKGYIS